MQELRALQKEAGVAEQQKRLHTGGHRDAGQHLLCDPPAGGALYAQKARHLCVAADRDPAGSADL